MLSTFPHFDLKDFEADWASAQSNHQAALASSAVALNASQQLARAISRTGAGGGAIVAQSSGSSVSSSSSPKILEMTASEHHHLTANVFMEHEPLQQQQSQILMADDGDAAAAMAAAAAAANGLGNCIPQDGSPFVANGILTQPQYTVEYLSQLLKDKKQLAAFPNVFHTLERLADEEISRVRVALFQFEFTKDNITLPEPEGEVTVHTEKVYVPAKEHPDYNFVGRILGPRGMTAKQLEQETGCKIMVRGRGSMRDKKKEEMNRGKPNWEHLSEELHVLIQCEDTANRAKVKLFRTVEEVKKLLVPAPEGEDELKRKQLMELAIINGTYRSGADQNALAAAHLAAVKQQPLAAALQAALVQQQHARGILGPMVGANGLTARSPTIGGVVGAPIVMSPSGRAGSAGNTVTSQAAAMQLMQQQAANANLASAQQAALLQQQQAEYQQLLLGGMYDLNTAAALQQQYAAAAGQNAAVAAAAQAQYNGVLAASQASAAAQQYSDFAGVDLTTQQTHGAMLNNRRLLGGSREHPYKQ